jgi:hypothetical protein
LVAVVMAVVVVVVVVAVAVAVMVMMMFEWNVLSGLYVRTQGLCATGVKHLEKMGVLKHISVEAIRR